MNLGELFAGVSSTVSEFTAHTLCGGTTVVTTPVRKRDELAFRL